MATLAERQMAQMLEGAVEIVTACKELYFLDSEAIAFAQLLMQIRVHNKLIEIEALLKDKSHGPAT